MISDQAKDSLTTAGSLGGLGGLAFDCVLYAIDRSTSLWLAVAMLGVGVVVGVSLELSILVRRARRQRRRTRCVDRRGHVYSVRPASPRKGAA